MATAGRMVVVVVAALAPPIATPAQIRALPCPSALQRRRLNSPTQVPHGRFHSAARSAIQTRSLTVTMDGRNDYQEAKVPSCKNSSKQVSKLLSTAVALAATSLVAATSISVEAADSIESLGLEAGAIFQRTCAGCHSGGGNIIQPAATLFKKDLDKNGLVAVDDIYTITYSGKNRMPGYGEKCTPRGQCTFGPRLSEDDIRALAEFVKLQADQGWAKMPN